MKPLYLKDILNYEYPVTALNSSTSQANTGVGFDEKDLCRDFYGWRSLTKDPTDIYFEISEADTLNCFAFLGTNLTNKAQVYISGSNTSGIGGFSAPLFTKTLIRKNQNWIFYSSTPLPSCQYYKLTIVENGETEQSYIEAKRIISGKALQFPIDLLDGFMNGKESYQKRETQKGQWRPGSENSMLNIFDIEFSPIFNNRGVTNNDSEVYDSMIAFIEDVKTTKPFLVILNPIKPDELFEYVTVAEDSVDISIDDGGTAKFSLSLKELK